MWEKPVTHRALGRISMWKPNFTIFGANYHLDFSWHLKSVFQPNWDSLPCCKNMLRTCLSLYYSHCLEQPPCLCLVKMSPPCLTEMPLHHADFFDILIFLLNSKPFSSFYQLSCDLSFYSFSLVIYMSPHISGICATCPILPVRENIFYSQLHLWQL